MTRVPHPMFSAAVAAAGAPVAGPAAGAPWWATVAGAFATLLAVTITVIWSAWARKHENDLTKQAAQFQLIGATIVAQNRLDAIREDCREPADGYASFERLLNVAYGSEVARLMATRPTIVPFFEVLGDFEDALSTMRSSFAKANELVSDGHASTHAQQSASRLIDAAVEAAGRASNLLVQMRAHCGGSRRPD